MAVSTCNEMANMNRTGIDPRVAIGSRNPWIGGWFARVIYLSLYKMQELALHGFGKVALDTSCAASRYGPSRTSSSIEPA